jgi:hypothetical protein
MALFDQVICGWIGLRGSTPRRRLVASIVGAPLATSLCLDAEELA